MKAPALSAALALLLSLTPLSRAAAEAERMTLPRPDGSRIDWFLDRRGATGPQGILVLAQGSGCASVTGNRNLETAKRLLPEFAVVTVEKYGVAPGDAPRAPDDCTAAFFANHTVSQRVSDYAAVIRHLRAEPWWSGQLVLFGGSEGGAVVQILAGEIEPSAAVIFSAATGVPFRDAFVQVIPPPMAAEAAAQLAQARANPLSAQVWGGNSYRWWADIDDRALWEDALKSRSPLLVIQGARDSSNPVASARALRDRFAAAGRCNLTYREYADYDHGMADPAGVSHLTEVLDEASNWIRASLADPSCGPD